jgi:hypothetical protein
MLALPITANFKGTERHVTVPADKHIKVGTLAEILGDIASYLDLTREQLIQELFACRRTVPYPRPSLTDFLSPLLVF